MIDLITSTLASTVRSWRGTMAMVRKSQPEHLLVLYDMEGCPFCRLVRETLTEFDLDVLIKPCPKGDFGYWDELALHSDSHQVPLLVDQNTDQVITESKDIIAYLHETYGKGARSAKQSKAQLQSAIVSGIRLGRGTRGRPSKRPKQPLELYSFESSPYSRMVREVLTELGIAYILHNVGKQQRSDIGVPWLRMTLKPYHPIPGTKRAKFQQMTGKVQFPYLYDPNTGTGLFESKDIVRYLRKQYEGNGN